MTPRPEPPVSWDGLFDSLARRLDRIEGKLDALSEQVARITATCAERGELLRTVRQDLYGDGGTGLKFKTNMVWLLLSGIGGGLIVLLGELAASALAKVF